MYVKSTFRSLISNARFNLVFIILAYTGARTNNVFEIAVLFSNNIDSLICGWIWRLSIQYSTGVSNSDYLTQLIVRVLLKCRGARVNVVHAPIFAWSTGSFRFCWLQTGFYFERKWKHRILKYNCYSICTEKLTVPILVSVDKILTHQYAEKILYLRLCFRNAKECARKCETGLTHYENECYGNEDLCLFIVICKWQGIWINCHVPFFSDRTYGNHQVTTCQIAASVLCTMVQQVTNL